MLAWGEKAPSRAEMMPSPRSATAPDPRRSSSLPVGNLPSASTPSDTGVPDRRFTFTLADTSPIPDDDPSTKRLAVSTGSSSVPAKKCGGVPPEANGMMRRLAAPADRCLHHRQHHAEVDPVGDAVGEGEGGGVHVHAEVQGEVDHLVLDYRDAVAGAVAADDGVAAGEVHVGVGEDAAAWRRAALPGASRTADRCGRGSDTGGPSPASAPARRRSGRRRSRCGRACRPRSGRSRRRSRR